MRVISPLDLRRSLGAILDAASAGERFLVERDRRPLAMLVSVEDGRRLDPDPAEARRRRLVALDRLEALAARTERSAAPPVFRQPAPVPVAPALVVPSPAPPASATPDRHESERRRHADEGLVGLG